jgi:hypothetical protein
MLFELPIMKFVFLAQSSKCVILMYISAFGAYASFMYARAFSLRVSSEESDWRNL